MRPRSKTKGLPAIDAPAGRIATSAKGTDARPTAASALGDRLAFVRGFLAHPGQVGSVIPSSCFLEDRLVRIARASQARTLVELGPGTGGTTRALLQAMRPDARLLAIELSPYFHRRLLERIADPRLALHLGSAEQLAEVLGARHLPAPDLVLSGIPFSTMPADTARQIAAAVSSSLAPGGRFVAYQVRAQVVQYFAPHLGPPEMTWEWRNMPPQRVFRWTRPTGPA